MMLWPCAAIVLMASSGKFGCKPFAALALVFADILAFSILVTNDLEAERRFRGNFIFEPKCQFVHILYIFVQAHAGSGFYGSLVAITISAFKGQK